MATASDDFNRADGGPGANWASVLNSLNIAGNGLEGDSAVEREQCIRWAGAGAPFTTEQFSEIVMSGGDAGNYYYGVAVRCATGGAATYYSFYGSNTDSYLQRSVAGATTQLGSTGAGFPDGATVRLEVTGTGATVTLTLKVNGAAWTSINAGGTINDTSGSRLTSGQVGCAGFARDDGTPRIDSWSGGDLSGTPGVLSSATPSGTLGTSTTATIGATTDQTTGTFYAVVDSAANLVGVTATQIKAGQKASGAAALAANSAAVSTTTPSAGVTGLTASTGYSYAAVQNNTNGDTNVVTGTFTTAAGGSSLLKKMRRYM